MTKIDVEANIIDLCHLGRAKSFVVPADKNKRCYSNGICQVFFTNGIHMYIPYKIWVRCRFNLDDDFDQKVPMDIRMQLKGEVAAVAKQIAERKPVKRR